jgi:hypothetical protein
VTARACAAAGAWEGARWRPPCGQVDYFASPAAAAALIAGRRFFLLGDSVLRELMLALQALVAPLPAAAAGDAAEEQAARAHLKLDCAKHGNARRAACALPLGAGADAQFSWWQWMSAAHRPRNLTRLTADQELDICSGRRAPVAACVAELFANATARDVAVLRVGLNYILFDGGLNGSAPADAAFAADAREFLPALARLRFPGTLVFMLLAPTMPRGAVKCAGTRQWDEVFWAAPPKTARINAVMKELLAEHGFGDAVVDPFDYTTAEVVGKMYRDCVHPDAPVQKAAANTLLNLLAVKAPR